MVSGGFIGREGHFGQSLPNPVSSFTSFADPTSMEGVQNLSGP